MVKLFFMCRNWLKIRLFFPNSDISLLSSVAKDTVVGKDVSIGAGSSVVHSNLGDNTTIHKESLLRNVSTTGNVMISSRVILNHVGIGKFSYIAPDTSINQTSIGSFCSIGPALICGYGEHPSHWMSTNPIFFSTLKQCGVSFSDKNLFEEVKRIDIGHDVWIGARVFIRNGISIGNGAIIGAGAVIVKDVPDYAVVAGVPAKVIRYRFLPCDMDQLNNLEWWNWSEEKLRFLQPYFVQEKVQDLLEASLNYRHKNK